MAKLKKEAGRESTESFLREARLTACLQHPNIISVYDLGFDDNDSPYFTMELLSSKSLHEIIKEKSLNQNQLLDVFNKVWCVAMLTQTNYPSRLKARQYSDRRIRRGPPMRLGAGKNLD